MLRIITGDNTFAAQSLVREAVQAFVATYTDLGLEQLDGEVATIERIQEAIESMPFLATHKLVVLKNPSAHKSFMERATDLLSDMADTTDVIVYEHKLDKRTAYYKFLKQQPGFVEVGSLEHGALRAWVAAQAKDRGASLSPSDAGYLIDRVGTDQYVLHHEIAKLATYDQSITRQTIDELTEKTPQSTTFDLLDAALGGDPKRALALYQEQRLLKVEPQQILALLGWQLHGMAVVQAAGNRDAASIAREAKLNPYVVRKTQALVRRMATGQVSAIIARVTDLDIRLKTQRIDADEALQNLIISLH